MTTDGSTPVATRVRTRVVLVAGLVLMAVGASQNLAWTAYQLGILPVGLWGVLENGGSTGPFDAAFGVQALRGLAWTVGFVLVSVVALGVVRRRAVHRLPMTVVVLGTVLVVSWSLQGRAGPAHHDARQGFGTLRPALDDVVDLAARGEVDGPYAELPRSLAFVSANGSVDVYHEPEDPDAMTIFVPQWFRLVDDAGGYIYSPHRTPDLNMHGMPCTDPVRLDEEWWSCGMPVGTP